MKFPAHPQIATIPEAAFYNYRLGVIFDGYKWDLQAGEQSTIGPHVVLLERDTLDFLAESAVALYHETVAMEQALRTQPELRQRMGISDALTDALRGCNYDPAAHLRLMRFDFHPTVAQIQSVTDGDRLKNSLDWRVSEVNSDVPAGYPEASVLPRLAAPFFDGYASAVCFGEVLAERYTRLLPRGGTIAFLHDTHTVEDYQILRYVGDILEKRGFRAVYVDPCHVQWERGVPKGIDAIHRHYPMEWMEYAPDTDWRAFVNTDVPSCNHPAALLTQSKRLPLVWDALGVNIPTWRRFLPETVCPTHYKNNCAAPWILKPAFGRVGQGINVPGTVSDDENRAIEQAARAQPLQWVAQRRFESAPINGLHLGLGVFVIDGIFAGLFGRVSSHPRLDSEATEVPVLVKTTHNMPEDRSDTRGR
ncbi:MAG: glutathionylspermidine synthase family protein [Defluviitaleaceae bacterium]|nr:glutathionylspermidine synthase family protein [Defluviitaleaceae bacterium]